VPAGSLPRIVADANVLFPASLRDTLFRAHEAQLVEVCLSAQIWDEVTRNLRDTGRMTDAQVARLETAAQEFFALQGMLVKGYEPLVPSLTCDPKDRHVLAAAIQGGASTIVTVSLRHFPATSLAPHSIMAEHPDTFLSRLLAARPGALRRLLAEQAAAKIRPPQTVEELLTTLAVHVPRFAASVRTAMAQPSA
jgi:predicted nucleic acid-binding protein